MTPQLAPQTAFNELADAGLQYLQDGKPPSEFELRRYEREIEALSKVDPAGYLELRGYVAAIRGKNTEADSYFERAIAISGHRIGPVTRYMAVLATTARTDEVLSHFRKYWDDYRGDPAALRSAESVLTFAGWFATANSVGGELAKRGLEIGGFHGTEDAESFVSEAEVAQAVGFSHRFLNHRGVRARKVQAVHVPHEDGNSTLLYQLGVDGAPDEVAELEWDLFGALDEAAMPAEQQGRVRIALATWHNGQDDHARHAE